MCFWESANIACDMETILAIAGENGLKVIEDAAQGVMSRYKGGLWE